MHTVLADPISCTKEEFVSHYSHARKTPVFNYGGYKHKKGR